MVDSKGSTPERELLKLIENEKGASSVSPSRVKRKIGLFSLSGLKGRLSFLKNKISKSFSIQGLNIKTLNKVLAIVLFLLFAYVTTDMVLSMGSLQEELEGAFFIDREPSSYYISDVPPPEDMNYYLDKVEKRDIFSLVSRKTVKTLKKQEVKEKAGARDKTKHLKLVGISWSDDPDAMIEDTLAHKTLFVKKGDMISDVRVEDIFKDKVILNYKGEKIEIK